MNRRKFLKTRYSGTFMFESFNQLLKKSACSLIRCYQWTRFLRRPSCRFYPSCSEYTNKCIQRHGLFKGVLAGSLRIARCHPFHPGGLDEVPESICLFKPISNRNFER